MPIKDLPREVSRMVTAHMQTEGGGFVVRRPVPSADIEVADPFLLLDEMGPVDYAPEKAVGAPDHPHRGFETVTYLLEGEFEHEDSAGHRGRLGPGDVQWMTAGSGVVHSEMPSAKIRKEGGRVHGFQIWINLPARLKMSEPRYQELSANKIPEAQSHDGRARVRVIAGEALGVKAAIDTHTPIVYQDWTLDKDADVKTNVPSEQDAMVYVFRGRALIGEGEKVVQDGELGVLGKGNSLRLQNRSDEPARLLLLAGVPIREPIAHYGPFVMNTEEEIWQAISDYRSGRLGEIRREGQVK